MTPERFLLPCCRRPTTCGKTFAVGGPARFAPKSPCIGCRPSKSVGLTQTPPAQHLPTRAMPHSARAARPAGTALVCVTWCRADVFRTAVGLDLDPEPLCWGMSHNAPLLGGSAPSQLCLLQCNVRPPRALASLCSARRAGVGRGWAEACRPRAGARQGSPGLRRGGALASRSKGGANILLY